MALAAISNGELVSTMRSAALLSPIAYLGEVTSPLARLGAETLLAEVRNELNHGLFLVFFADFESFFDRLCIGWTSMNSILSGEELLRRIFLHPSFYKVETNVLRRKWDLQESCD